VPKPVGPDLTVRARRADAPEGQLIGSRTTELQQLESWGQSLTNKRRKLENLGRSFGQMNQNLIEEEQTWEKERVRLDECDGP
jgi:hypothetical protein